MFLDKRCEKLGTNHNVNSFSIRSFFGANCCWKCKWLSLLKKRQTTLVILTQNWSILAKFAQKIQQNRLFFYWLFLGEVSPLKSADFLRICPWKSFEIWHFSPKIPRNRPIFLRILTFLPRKIRPISQDFRKSSIFPRKSHEIGRFFREFAPENPAKCCFFFREISEALLRCA